MSTKAPRRGIIFWAAIIVVAYALMSAAIAISTADECGDLDADKKWNLIPPEWECVR